MIGWENPIIRLPFITTNICPVCGVPLTHNKSAPVFLSDAETNRRFVREFDLPYCLRCGLPFANETALDRIWKNTRIKPDTFEAENDKNKNIIQIHARSIRTSLRKTITNDKNKSGENKGEVYLGFPIDLDGYSDPYKPHNFVFNNEIRSFCPECDTKLRKMNVGVPFDAKKKVIIHGQGCLACDTLYIHQSLKKRMQKLLHKNRFASDFQLLLDSPYDFEQVQEERRILQEKEAQRKQKIESLQPLFEKYPSAYVVLSVEEISTNSRRDVVIVNSYTDKDTNNNVYHYSSPEGLEYLSAAFSENLQKQGMIGTKAFIIEGIVYEKGARGQELINEWILDLFLNIRPDGGNRSSTLNDPNKKLVDMLVYCTKTDRYEIMRTTWDKKNDEYYTDMHHYWDFVYKYGKPEIELVFYDSRKNSYRRDWKDLNDESILMQFGYNVREGGPNEIERRKILGDLVDLQILTQNQIMRYLDFFINHHKHHSNAISKWVDDNEYIMNYEYNPYRFVLNR